MYFDKAYTIYDQTNSSEAFPLLELQKGLTLKASNKLEEAITVFKKTANTNRDAETSKVEAIYQISKIYYLQEDYEKALEYSKKSLRIG
jgi:tetratricopeptide (TPR) repeat protein